MSQNTALSQPENVFPFDFDGKSITVLVDKHGDPWWVAKEVCAVLQIKNVSRALVGLDDDEKGIHSMNTPGGTQDVSIINEPGLYSLILRSRKPEAKAFKRWVTHEVLPSVRQHGFYAVTQEPSLPKNEHGLIPLDVLGQIVQSMAIAEHERLEQKAKIDNHEDRIQRVEAHTAHLEEPEMYSVRGWARIRGHLGVNDQKVGSLASRLAKKRGIELGSVADRSFGKLNAYPLELLDEVYDEIEG